MSTKKHKDFAFNYWINHLCDDSTSLCALPMFKVYIESLKGKYPSLKGTNGLRIITDE